MAQITLELDDDLAKKISNLARYIGDKDLMFTHFIDFHEKKTKREIARMEQDLYMYETKYKMASPIFYDQFEAGQLPDSQDFVVWSGIYEMLLESRQKLEALT